MNLINWIVWSLFPNIRRQKQAELDRLESHRAVEKYHLLKAMICKAHFSKQNGMTIQLSDITLEDLKSFRAPMYRFSFNKDTELRIAWDYDMMNEEIGSGEKLVTGERAESTSGKVLSEAGEAGV